ncbi:hypothetical protein N7456_010990 [Penicillium angulare]|uniref:Aminoglycoside phosphotransferase domain-containing protein n=1 Tax=Penicillium angulare TaxID=116970 RepID=A0A9W9JZA3_9EURO|nr:hypothetical protein N7456_010990 [Penicillium angulare]
MRALSRLLRRSHNTLSAKADLWSNNRDLFEYTSGRFLFNEELRRTERRIEFDVDALARTVCNSVGRHLDNVSSITKLAEGGFNRVLEITFNDNYAVLARLPYTTTVPRRHVVTSEAATLAFLQSHGVPVPAVLAYSPDHTNAVGTEYMLLEKINGTSLGDQWFSMDTKTRVKVMKQIVDLEKQFMSISFPASGSLYYSRDLDCPPNAIPASPDSHLSSPDQIVIGPTAQHEWWYQQRALLDVDRGPWTTFNACFEAPVRREIEFCKKFGKPRLHVERYLRELHHLEERSPVQHQLLLSDYLKLAPYLELPQNHRLSRPTLRHPDFSPNNILVDSSSNVVGIIDWQHAVVLPLCLCAGIPQHFQNWSDPLSERLAKPEVKLPENFDSLSQEEQETTRETMRRRIVHFYYAALTMSRLPDHFDAFRDTNSMLRAKLFQRAGAPWEGDSVSLKHTLIQACQNWPMQLDGEATHKECANSPIGYSEEEIQQCLNDYAQEQERMQELEEMREMIGTDALGWVPNDDELEQSIAICHAIKAGLLENSSTEMERIAVQAHFPFDDHEEYV